MAETIYKASNSPVKIASTVIPRVQDFSITTNQQRCQQDPGCQARTQPPTADPW
jgi:hypothetical protein